MSSAEHEGTPERPPKTRGAGIIYHVLPTNELIFYRRDNKPQISCPDMIDILGGHMDPGETPEATARREAGEELLDRRTGEPYRPGILTKFKSWVDDRPGEHNIFIETLDYDPDWQLLEGQALVRLTPEAARSTEFAYGYSQVVNEYLDSLEAKSE